jgi:hypothetical protein
MYRGRGAPEKLLDLAERFPRPGRSSFLTLYLARSSSPEPRDERGDPCLLSDDGFSNVSLRNVAAQGSVWQHVLAVLVFTRIYPAPREIWMTKAIYCE